ncbi:hypothetical protein KSS87_006840 [Heliosperma pusillum]|nr:hypothetical protein KSS87_006840 [Heliosperma pusillum]
MRNNKESYRKTRLDVKFELVEPIISTGKLRNGEPWYHCNFRAKPEGQDSSLTKVFFGELKVVRFDHKSKTAKYMCTACRPLSGKITNSCEMCGDKAMIHPTSTFRQGRYPSKIRVLRPRSEGKVIQASKRAKVVERKPFGPSLYPTNN